MNTEELLKKLKSNVSNKAQQTLDLIYEICIEQVERGVADFSAATISRLGQKRGVPKAQSIRNKSGVHYRALLQAFTEQHSSIGLQLSIPRRADAWITEIKDPKIQLLVRMQAADLAKAKRMIKEIVPPGLQVCIDDRGSPGTECRLNNVERKALEYTVEKQFLLDNDFVVGKYGDVLNSEGNKVFRPGTIDGIKRALEYL